MRPNITVLRRLLKTWQKQWRMEDWTIRLELVDHPDEDAPSRAGWNTLETCNRAAYICLSRNPPQYKWIDTTLPVTLAHEFAHILVADLAEQFKDAVHYNSDDWKVAQKAGWERAEERFCNAFAEAVTRDV